MKQPDNIPLVTTIKEQCRVCYTCVRECPAKAIRIGHGQAEVIAERCIGCGNCVRVCSQRAKQIYSGIERVNELLACGKTVAACLAPSFPAEFADWDAMAVVSAARAMGFSLVNEVAFGADLVAAEYARLLRENPNKRFIATTCPAIVSYVEKYYPGLKDYLAPIVSPMVATARALRKIHGPELKIVFVGPCIAKKGESASVLLSGDVDAALTFVEFREMLAHRGVNPSALQPSEFDPPRGCMGGIYPISRGMLQAAGLKEDLLNGHVVATEGRRNFVEALEEFQSGDMDARLLEVLCCEGCIMGAGMGTDIPLFQRRSRVSRYVRESLSRIDRRQWGHDMQAMASLDLMRTFIAQDQRIAMPLGDELSAILARMGKVKNEDELNCGACGYETCRAHAVAIYKGLAESEMCLPYTIEQLKKTVKELAVSNDQLASTQEALMQSEKLASMGQLAAGIAHEVNNPLGVVLIYAHLLLDDCDRQSKMHQDLSMIVQQADRCKKIVAGLLHFARQNKVVLEPTHLGKLTENTLKTMTFPENIAVRIETATNDLAADVDADQIAQVLVNLLHNAVAAMPDGGKLTVRIAGDNDYVRLSVIDTGTGIAKEHIGKVFEPFFTTKQIGKGTGLGLAVTYGIIKMHRGDIRVESNSDATAGPTGTTFVATLPRHDDQIGFIEERPSPS